MRIAVLADTHGNLLALGAVLSDLLARAPDLVVNLGDLFTGPFDPAGSADAQIALGCPTLAGNHERNLLEGDDTSPSVAFARPRLSASHLDWLEKLPKTLRFMDGEVFACHGSQRAATSTTCLGMLRAVGLSSHTKTRSGGGWQVSARRAWSCAATHMCRAWYRSAAYWWSTRAA